MSTKSLYLFPQILKTTLPDFNILVIEYSAFISDGFFQLALEVSLCQVFSWCSASLCFSQNSHSIVFATILIQNIFDKESNKLPKR